MRDYSKKDGLDQPWIEFDFNTLEDKALFIKNNPEVNTTDNFRYPNYGRSVSINDNFEKWVNIVLNYAIEHNLDITYVPCDYERRVCDDKIIEISIIDFDWELYLYLGIQIEQVEIRLSATFKKPKQCDSKFTFPYKSYMKVIEKELSTYPDFTKELLLYDLQDWICMSKSPFSSDPWDVLLQSELGVNENTGNFTSRLVTEAQEYLVAKNEFNKLEEKGFEKENVIEVFSKYDTNTKSDMKVMCYLGVFLDDIYVKKCNKIWEINYIELTEIVNQIDIVLNSTIDKYNSEVMCLYTIVVDAMEKEEFRKKLINPVFRQVSISFCEKWVNFVKYNVAFGDLFTFDMMIDVSYLEDIYIGTSPKCIELNFNNRVEGGILGAVVGDALGVPVEFTSREDLLQNPIIDMVGFGTYDQPPGTWSDDSSMLLITAEKLIKDYSPKKIMDGFYDWYNNSYMTPHGEVFDIGQITTTSMLEYEINKDIDSCGQVDEYSNGNGSLMRIIPISIYFHDNTPEMIIKASFEVSKLTHGHIRSQLCCAFYSLVVKALIEEKSLSTSITYAASKIKSYIPKEEVKILERLLTGSILDEPEDNIESSGYVVSSLESALWCCYNSMNYSEAVLKAVNLGDDTDTTATITGGLAGIMYGKSAIPKKWINGLVQGKMIQDIADMFANKVKLLTYFTRY